MPPKKYSIYASDTLDRVLAARLPADKEEQESGFRSRSGLVSAILDRYHETCRRSMPYLSLNAWLLIFDASNGCWMMDNAQLAANGLSLNISDACSLNGYDQKWHVSDGQALALEIDAMTFAEKVAILDAAERFWALDLQPDGTEPTDTDPHAHWRAPVRGLVGYLADEETR